jgi:hypothetical protein
VAGVVTLEICVLIGTPQFQPILMGKPRQALKEALKA